MLNDISLMGRITAEPVIKRTSSDIAVCTFDLAVQRSRRNKDGEKVTDFFRCEVWRKQAEFLGKYCHKGSMVVVNGELHNEKYVDKDGNNRTSTKVVVANILLYNTLCSVTLGIALRRVNVHEHIKSVHEYMTAAHARICCRV